MELENSCPNSLNERNGMFEQQWFSTRVYKFREELLVNAWPDLKTAAEKHGFYITLNLEEAAAGSFEKQYFAIWVYKFREQKLVDAWPELESAAEKHGLCLTLNRVKLTLESQQPLGQGIQIFSTWLRSLFKFWQRLVFHHLWK